MAKKKQASVQALSFLRDAVNARLDDATMAEKAPTLLECLLPKFDAGKLVRAAGSLKISVEGAHWKIVLTCPTERLQCVWCTNQLTDLFDLFETQLRAGHVIWSPTWERNKKLPTIDEAIQ